MKGRDEKRRKKKGEEVYGRIRSRLSRKRKRKVRLSLEKRKEEGKEGRDVERKIDGMKREKKDEMMTNGE